MLEHAARLSGAPPPPQRSQDDEHLRTGDATVKKAYSCLTAAPLLDVALAGAAPAAAQALGMADGSKFDVALYGWFPAISGSTSFPPVDPEGPGMGSRHSGSKSIPASKGVAKRSILVSSLALHPYGHRMMQRERELTQNTMRRFGAAVAARFAAVATASDRKPHARQFFGHPPTVWLLRPHRASVGWSSP